MAKKLQPKQKAFVDQYLVDLNGTQAYLRAGYKCSVDAARVNAAKLLANANIQAAVAERMKDRAERTEIDQDRVLLEIARLAFSDPRRIFDGTRLKRMDEIDDSTAAAISSIKVVTRQAGEGEVEHVAEIKFWSKPTALEQAGKHTGLFGADNAQKNAGQTFAEALQQALGFGTLTLPSQDRANKP